MPVLSINKAYSAIKFGSRVKSSLLLRILVSSISFSFALSWSFSIADNSWSLLATMNLPNMGEMGKILNSLQQNNGSAPNLNKKKE